MNPSGFALGRIIRILIGAVLVLGVFYGANIGMGWLNPWGWVGLFPLLSGLVGWPRSMM